MFENKAANWEKTKSDDTQIKKRLKSQIRSVKNV
jgi:hypothetical protein